MTAQESIAWSPTDMAQLRLALAGVRALLLDIDGVLVRKGQPIPGAAEALASLAARGFPYLLATNTSLVSRQTMAAQLTQGGLTVEPDRIVTSASAAAAYVRRRFRQEPLYVMVAPDARIEFDGLRLLSHDEAAAMDAHAAAVVVGDAADDFTTRNLQSAFTLLRGGARFVAMHKNRWWMTPAGATMDSGSYVAALEYATQRRSLVTGKPSRALFAEAVRILGRSARHSAEDDLVAGDVAMVGDDLWSDVRGAQRAGLRGVFVRTGKHGDAELARISRDRGRSPDGIAPSIAEIVDALAG